MASPTIQIRARSCRWIASRKANTAPSYRGRTCWAGVEYFVVDKDGGAWACRTAKRYGEGYLGNIFDGAVARLRRAIAVLVRHLPV